jgi:hypothetical protein
VNADNIKTGFFPGQNAEKFNKIFYILTFGLLKFLLSFIIRSFVRRVIIFDKKVAVKLFGRFTFYLLWVINQEISHDKTVIADVYV